MVTSQDVGDRLFGDHRNTLNIQIGHITFKDDIKICRLFLISIVTKSSLWVTVYSKDSEAENHIRIIRLKLGLLFRSGHP